MKIRTWRRMTEIFQAILILGLPFLRINGESALRFDIPTLRLHFFGASLWMQEFFIVLVAGIFLTLLIVLVTLLFGRVWCGWLCPQTVLVDFTPFMDRAARKGFVYKGASYLMTFAVSVLIAASLIWYFVSPYEFFPGLLRGSLGQVTWGFWLVLTGILFLNFAFLRHRFCATICPYAKLQSVLFDKSTLIIELDPARANECINCSGCVRACPTGIDIRKGADAACINCAECLDACSRVMSKLNKNGLIHYAFGVGGGGSILRQNVFVVGGFVLLFLAATLFFSMGRTGIDLTVLPHNLEPRIVRDGRILNAYVLSVKNMTHKPVTLYVTVERFDATVSQSLNEPIRLGPEMADKFPLFVKTQNPLKLKGSRKIAITLQDRERNITVTEDTNFVVPDEL